MDKQNFFQKLRLGPTAVPVVIFSILIFLGFSDSKSFVDVLWGVFKWLMVNIGWLVDLGCLGFVLTLIFICVHPIGRVRFGGPDARPNFNTWNWWAISLCAGIGTGIVFWGAVEPLKHTFAPAGGMNMAAGSKEAMIWAMQTSFLHWTITPYAIYCMAAVAIGLAYYNLGKKYTVSSGLVFLSGKKELSPTTIGIVDGITLFAITGGVAGSLGYGLLQIGSGLDFTFNLTPGPMVWTGIALCIITTYTISSATGLDRGIKWLSDKNAWIFIGLLLFVIVMGPTAFIFNLTTQSFGAYVSNFIEAMTFTDPLPGGDLWPQWWDMYWFVDWLSFGPIVGLFLIKLCYGRTLREFVVVNMLLPALFGMIWFGAFGGFALDLQITQNIDILSFMNENGTESLMLKVMEYLPLVEVVRPLLILTIALSFVTLADSMTSTVALMSLKDNDNKEAPLSVKLFWGLLMGGTALIFVLNGGLEGIKVVKTIAGFPILFLEIMMMVGVIRYLYVNSRKLLADVARSEDREAAEKDDGVTTEIAQ
ncbi:MAG: BCCT family transporter [Desulfobacterales bacterium]|nr:BCCT family transporter [Desulfobacterales bacterium]